MAAVEQESALLCWLQPNLKEHGNHTEKTVLDHSPLWSPGTKLLWITFKVHSFFIHMYLYMYCTFHRQAKSEVQTQTIFCCCQSPLTIIPENNWPENCCCQSQNSSHYYIPHKWIVLFARPDWLARRWLAKYCSPLSSRRKPKWLPVKYSYS